MEKKEFSSYQNRGKLADMLPLDTPLSIHLCPSTFCNFKCNYCWHSLEGKDNMHIAGSIKKELMDMELYQLIIKQIAEFPQKLKLLNFAWCGEPLLHPQIAEMVSLAKSYNGGIAERVEIVTNASMLTPELGEQLAQAGLDRIRISLQGLTEEAYYHTSRVKIDYDKFLNNLKYFYDHKRNTEVYIKIMDVMAKTEEEKERFQELFSDKADYLNIENLVPLVDEIDLSSEKKVYEKGYFGNKIRNIEVCPTVFFALIISPGGIVLPCCSADSYEGSIGTISKEITLREIWNGRKLAALRRDMLKKPGGGYKNIPMCKKCTYPLYHTADTDYLDEERTLLLEKYKINL